MHKRYQRARNPAPGLLLMDIACALRMHRRYMAKSFIMNRKILLLKLEDSLYAYQRSINEEVYG
jgi:hypothetical protein